MSGNRFGVWCLVGGVCLAAGALLCVPAPAGAAEASSDPLFAGWFSQHASSWATRSNVVRLCIGVMALALFIMMKKFSEDRGQKSEVRSQKRTDTRGPAPSDL